MRSVSPTEAYNAVLHDPESVIVDVRELGESAGTAISGAIALPLTRFARDWKTIADKKHLFFICASGGRSGMAADYMDSQGHPDAVNIAGGVLAWDAEGLPFAE